MQRIKDSILTRICIAAVLALALVPSAVSYAQPLEIAQESDGEITRTPRDGNTSDEDAEESDGEITRTPRTGNTTDEDAEEPAEEPAPQTQSEGGYTGPVYGYSIEYDPDVWTLDAEIQEGNVDGVRLYSDTSTYTIWAWDAYGNDPLMCLEGEVEYYSTQVDSISNWEPALDDNGDLLRYESDNLAWGVFDLTYTSSSGNSSPLVDYISCEPIPGQDAVLIVLLSSDPDTYNSELDHALDVLDTLQFSDEADTTANDETETSANDVDVTDTTGMEIDTNLAGSLYTSPNYGYTAEIPLEWQILDESVDGSDERLVVGNGTSIVTLWATDEYAGDLAGCVDFAAASSGLSLELDTDADGGEFRGVYRNEAFGNFVYEDDGVQMMYFINCRAIPGTDGFLILIQDVEYDQFTIERGFRSDIENSIVMP